MAIATGNLSELYLTLGEIEKAVEYARKSFEFSERTDSSRAKYHGYSELGEMLYQTGNLKESEDYFKRLESIQFKNQPK